MKIPFAKARTYISEKVKNNYKTASQTAYKKAGVDLGESAYYAAIPIIATIAGKVIVVNARHSMDKYTSLINKPPEILSPQGIMKYGFDDPVGNFILGAGLTVSLLYGFVKSRATRISRKQHVESMIKEDTNHREEMTAIKALEDILKEIKTAVSEQRQDYDALVSVLSEDIELLKQYGQKRSRKKKEVESIPLQDPEPQDSQGPQAQQEPQQQIPPQGQQ